MKKQLWGIGGILLVIILSSEQLLNVSYALPNFWKEPKAKTHRKTIPVKDKAIRIFHFQIYDPLEDIAQSKRFTKEMKDVNAKRTGKAILLISIDSPGGDAEVVNTIVEEIKCSTVPTVAYIAKGRYGGVYGQSCKVAFACQKVYAHPDIKIGSKFTGEPMPLKLCKNLPCSYISSKTKQFWEQGISATELKSIIERKEIRRPIPDYNYHTISRARSYRKHINSGITVITAKEAKEKNYVCGLCKNVLEVIEQITQNKKYKEIRVVFKSTLNEQIIRTGPFFRQLDRFLMKIDTIDYKNTKQRLRYWQRIYTMAISLRSMLQRNPKLQLYLYPDLRNTLRSHYWHLFNNSEWAFQDLQTVIKDSKSKVKSLREQYKREREEQRERKREECKSKREQRRSNHNRSSKRYLRPR